MYSEQQKYEDAAKYYIMSIDNGNYMVISLLFDMYYDNGKYDEILKMYEKYNKHINKNIHNIFIY